MSFWSKVEFFYKFLILFIAFVIVTYVLTWFRIWSADFTLFFFRTGKWEGIIIVSLIVAAVSMLLIKMWQFQVRLGTKKPKKRRRRVR
jgi:uncharacterized membrane protein